MMRKTIICIYGSGKYRTQWHLKRGHKDINIKPDKNGISKEGITHSYQIHPIMACQIGLQVNERNSIRLSRCKCTCS
jgi:hypothetical protein